jgi:Raf kinase inhibitor-like YbhB/YbcL family protein
MALASCGATADKASKTVDQFTLTSSAFADEQAIPAQFTCDGAGQQPPLAWTDPPPGTKSFALVVDDPDAPSGTFRHWGAFNIPASARSLSGDFAQAVNDFGKTGYGGPCPPKGHGPHHYRFKLIALRVDRLDLSKPKVEQLEAEAGKVAVGRAELTGTYERR